MANIAYEYKLDINRDIDKIVVKLEKKKIGEILQTKTKDGWYYKPIKSKLQGDVMKSYVQVMRSLETED